MKRIVKKFSMIGLALVLASMMVFACTPAEPITEEPAAEEVAVEEPAEVADDAALPGKGLYFRLVTHGGDDPFWAVVKKGMEDAARETGARAEIDLCEGDLAWQMRAFEEAVAAGVDGIALVINDEEIWNEPVAEALEKGIPVIGIDNDHPDGAMGNPRLAYIGQDERDAGRALGWRLLDEAQERGIDLADAHIAFGVEIPGAPYEIDRSEAIMSIMEENGVTSFEKIDATMDFGTVESRQTSYLLANPQTTFMIGVGGITTDRLGASLSAAGYEPGEIIAGGYDMAPGTIEGIKDGYVTASVDAQQYTSGYFAVYVLMLAAKYGITPSVSAGGYMIDSVEDLELIEELSPQLVR